MTDIQNSLKSNIIKYNLLKHIIFISDRFIFLLKNMPKNSNNDSNSSIFYKLLKNFKLKKLNIKKKEKKIYFLKNVLILKFLNILQKANSDSEKLNKILELNKKSSKLFNKITKFLKRIKDKILNLIESEIANNIFKFIKNIFTKIIKGLKNIIIYHVIHKKLENKTNKQYTNNKELANIKEKTKTNKINEIKSFNKGKIINGPINNEDNNKQKNNSTTKQYKNTSNKEINDIDCKKSLNNIKIDCFTSVEENKEFVKYEFRKEENITTDKNKKDNLTINNNQNINNGIFKNSSDPLKEFEIDGYDVIDPLINFEIDGKNAEQQEKEKKNNNISIYFSGF